MNPMNIEAVLIAGKVRKWQGALVGVDDARVRSLAEKSRDDVIRRANFQSKLL
jgi:hypothetical protein